MSLDGIRDIRGYLCSASAITNQVPRSSIKIGWPRELDQFPCVLITQVAGTDVGLLGYKRTSLGSRQRREYIVFNIDIFSRDSRRETYSIADEITPIMIASGACRKTSDVDLYDDNLGVYRKLQSYAFFKHHND